MDEDLLLGICPSLEDEYYFYTFIVSQYAENGASM